WLHKAAPFTEDDAGSGVRAGDELTPELFERLLAEEYEKLLRADDRDVHEDSKQTTLPVSRELLGRYVGHEQKLPWLIDLLNLTIEDEDVEAARRRLDRFIAAFTERRERVTENVDFEVRA